MICSVSALRHINTSQFLLEASYSYDHTCYQQQIHVVLCRSDHRYCLIPSGVSSRTYLELLKSQCISTVADTSHALVKYVLVSCCGYLYLSNDKK